MSLKRGLSADDLFVNEYLSHTSIDAIFRHLTLLEIRQVIRDAHEPARLNLKKREQLTGKFPIMLPSTQRSLIIASENKRVGAGMPSLSKRRKVPGDFSFGISPGDESQRSNFDAKVFGIPVDREIGRARVQDFRDATSDSCFREVICVVCARRVLHQDSRPFPLHDIPNRHLLKPYIPHPQQFVYDHSLLHKPGVFLDGGFQTGYVCVDCQGWLKKGKVPQYALANNLWIGDQPMELARLNVAEQLLIAKVLTMGHVVKLYPKQVNAQKWQGSHMYSGLKGNISSFPLNAQNIVSVVAGQRLPHPPEILPSIFAITFVGPSCKNVPFLPPEMKVRRGHLASSLQFLSTNNPLYADIDIDDSVLQMYPEDGVPDVFRETTRVSDDIESLENERSGYVPDPEARDELSEIVGRATPDRDCNGSPIDPAESYLMESQQTGVDEGVILQSVGLIDMEGNTVTESEIINQNAENLLAVRDEHYSVPHGPRFVNEYPRMNDNSRFIGTPEDPNVILGCYPSLFPFALGGPDVDRPHHLSLDSYARWALQYEDRRFRYCSRFIFHIFSIINKRRIATSSGIQTKKASFQTVKHLFSKLTAADFALAKVEEEKRMPFSNPVMKKLRYHLSCTRARIDGTDESKRHLRDLVHSYNVELSPANIWLTLNPNDTSDPIAQVKAGVQISLDDFLASVGPNASERAENMARDPYASADYFYTVVNKVLEHLLGIRATKTRIHRKDGIFGRVAAYIGAVEEQQRGSLHAHFLVWLEDSPSLREIETALQDPAFRARLSSFISSIITADIDGKTTQQLLAIEKSTNVGFRRPLGLSGPSWYEEMLSDNAVNARTVQMHKCSPHACLKWKQNRWVCKRRAPWPLAEQTAVDENGNVSIRRQADMLNAWNPFVMQALGANHDVKFLCNTRLTALIAFYIAYYATKKRRGNLNTSAVLARRLAYHSAMENAQSDPQKSNERFLQRCANGLSTLQEMSSVFICSQLMGWKDRFISHTPCLIFLNSLYKHISDVFPQFQKSRNGRSTQGNVEDGQYASIRLVDGSLTIDDQVMDYIDRGLPLEHLSYYDFFLKTYDRAEKKKDETRSEEPDSTARRVQSERVYYLNREGTSRYRVYRQNIESIMPQFVGTWFPARDKPESLEYYCAVILAFFKPWRNLADIITGFPTFSAAFSDLHAGLSAHKLRMLDNIQFYHDCHAEANREQHVDYPDHPANSSYERPSDEGEEQEDIATNGKVWTEDDYLHILDNHEHILERQFGEGALGLASQFNIFQVTDEYSGTSDVAEQFSSKTSLDIDRWSQALSDGMNIPDIQLNERSTARACIQEAPTGEPVLCPQLLHHPRPETLPLSSDQLAPFNCLSHHIQTVLSGEDPPPLRMMVLGEGGTGKSHLIRAITNEFARLGLSHQLAKTATTGIASVAIGGMTVHSWAGLSVQKQKNDPGVPAASPSKSKREAYKRIAQTKYIIVDEISMLDKATLFEFSTAITCAVSKMDVPIPHDCSFGNLNVILTGDFHQFAPVKRSNASLYMPSHASDSDYNRMGSALYQSFDKVFILTQQKRSRDSLFSSILTHLRVGLCTSDDIRILKSLVLEEDSPNLPDFSKAPWSDCILVTPRHSVRMRWNNAAVEAHSKRTGNCVYLSPALDVAGRKPCRRDLDWEERCAVKKKNCAGKSNLEDVVPLCVGMRAMVTNNVSVQFGIANGSRGRITSIVLDEREQTPRSSAKRVALEYPPALVLLKLDHIPADILTFPGLDRGVIPITPIDLSFSISTQCHSSRTVHRTQIPLTPGYAFTDYKSQGQTIDYLLIDFGNVPFSSQSAASVYVALSRGRGLDCIRILRLHDDGIFLRETCEHLRREDERLAAIDRVMRSKCT